MRSSARGRCTEERIAIAAPAERVWAVLIDFARWGGWNPLYVDTAGTLAPGERIAMAVQLAGMKPRQAQATVTKVEPMWLIEYELKLLGGLLHATRYLELAPTGDGACRVANGEILAGVLGPLTARVLGAKVRDGLRGMNLGLKARAESDERQAAAAG